MWDETLRIKAESMRVFSEAKARADLFWADVRRKLGPEDSQRGEITIIDGVVWGSKIKTPDINKLDLPTLEDDPGAFERFLGGDESFGSSPD